MRRPSAAAERDAETIHGNGCRVEFRPDDVREAGEGAWCNAEALYDEHTGAWSGLWQGMELAGYYEPDTGHMQTYFPVLAP